jgi:hypothetical protein
MTEITKSQIEFFNKFIKDSWYGIGDNPCFYRSKEFTEEQIEQIKNLGGTDRFEDDFIKISFIELVEIKYNGDYDNAIDKELRRYLLNIWNDFQFCNEDVGIEDAEEEILYLFDVYYDILTINEIYEIVGYDLPMLK